VRYLEDGNIEYIGRIDEQVKIRGHRIELGEIERVVLADKEIKSAIAVVNKQSNIELFCKVSSPSNNDVDDKIISSWEDVWDYTYQNETDEDIYKNTELKLYGWKSSYTGESISKTEMLSWVNETVKMILNTNPKNILELGCGTGMLLFQIYDSIDYYIGMDISKKVIHDLKIIKRKNSMMNLSLYNYRADNFQVNRNLAIDTILLNSVIQYFPSINYLTRVIKKCITELNNNEGKIIIGDVLNLNLQEEFYYSIILHKTPSLSKQQIINQIKQKKFREEELFIHPNYFITLSHSFKEITDVKISLKESDFNNEVSNFRYDVIIYVNSEKSVNNTECMEYISNQKDDLSKLIGFIEKEDDIIHIKNILDKRLSNLKNIYDLEQENTLSQSNGIDIKQLTEYFKTKSYIYEISPSSNPKYFNLIVFKKNIKSNFLNIKSEIRSTNIISNTPMLLNSYKTTKINSFLSKKLPEYMIPATINIVDDMPLTPNGKVDKKQLLLLTEINSSKKYIKPKNAIQEKLFAIFKDTLHINECCIHDDFFQLGGHSLLAINLVTKINKDFNVNFALTDLYEASSIINIEHFIQGKTIKCNSLIVPINNSTSEKNIFALPGLGADIISFKNFSNCLEKKYKIYAFRYTSLDFNKKSTYTIENIASKYIEAMKKIQKTGPYTILGYSFGATIAYEMAYQLLSNNDSIKEFIILDAFYPEAIDLGSKNKHIPTLIYIFMLSRGIDIQESKVMDLSSIEDILIFLRKYNINLGYQELENYLNTTLLHISCSEKYSPKALSKEVLCSLYRIEDKMIINIPKNKEIPLDYNWGKLIKNISIYKIPGSHTSILQKNHVLSICKLL
jgi:thioesterase domain-containing protein/ubiquinone/menaquinone biosynthesis C-methylase UbiE/acyl carrier protein